MTEIDLYSSQTPGPPRYGASAGVGVKNIGAPSEPDPAGRKPPIVVTECMISRAVVLRRIGSLLSARTIPQYLASEHDSRAGRRENPILCPEDHASDSLNQINLRSNIPSPTLISAWGFSNGVVAK